MKKTAIVGLIFALALLLGVGDQHHHLQTEMCVACLHAPALIETARVVLSTTLVELGAIEIAPNAQPLSCLAVSFTLLRAPPLV